MFNFVIFSGAFYCYSITYGDIIGLTNVQYIEDLIKTKNKLINFLFRLHHSPRINNIINLPLKNIWNGMHFDNDFTDQNPICFLFFYRWLKYEKEGFFLYLKKKYPDAKFVIFFQDLIALQHFDIEYIKKIFDLVLCIDHNEAKLYNILYYPLVNSLYKYSLDSDLEESDVYFLGYAKNRMKTIIEIYELLKSLNLKCDFNIAGVASEKQVYKNSVNYISGMSYFDNLKHIAKTKCILEIMQQGQVGFTQRVCEAITYDKKIITNNPNITSAPFYLSQNICDFKEIADLKTRMDFMDGLNSNVDYHYKEMLSPVKLLEFITNNLHHDNI